MREELACDYLQNICGKKKSNRVTLEYNTRALDKANPIKCFKT